MKCIQCNTDNNLRDRTAHQGRCKNCNHPFVFEPTTMGTVKITDPFFAKAIADISANNTLYFTPKQLLYLLDKRKKRRQFVNSLYSYFVSNVFGAIISGVFLGAILGKYYLILSVTIVNIIFINSFYRDSQSNQFTYLQRQSNRKNLKIIGALLLGAGIPISLAISSFFLFGASVLLGMVSIYLGIRPTKSKAEISQNLLIEENDLQDWLNRWTQTNGEILKLLPSARENPTLSVVNPDVTAYSFDRLVVCDSSTIAQFLIANNFHFENNCAILSITGYPQSLFAITMQMLRRNPDLKVYALHNASPQGVSLVHYLRTSPKWFKNSNILIFDIGLLPHQILANPNVFIRSSEELATIAQQLPAEVRQNLSQSELEWLDSGNFVELESFPPQKLIQVLNRGMAGSQNLDLESEESGLILMGDAGYVYASDSFG